MNYIIEKTYLHEVLQQTLEEIGLSNILTRDVKEEFILVFKEEYLKFKNSEIIVPFHTIKGTECESKESPLCNRTNITSYVIDLFTSSFGIEPQNCRLELFHCPKDKIEMQEKMKKRWAKTKFIKKNLTNTKNTRNN